MTSTKLEDLVTLPDRASTADRLFRIVILTHGGCEHFIDEIAQQPQIEVAGVILETVTQPRRNAFEKIRRSVRYDGWIGTLRKMPFLRSRRADAVNPGTTSKSVADAAERNSIPYFTVDNFHKDSSIELLDSFQADLGVIWGTNIVKRSVFAAPRLGSVNLHQGHAPFYRGGPTVFWELMNNESEIGITVHFVEDKVDTGDIVAQMFMPLVYNWSIYGTGFEQFLDEIRSELVSPSVKLMVKAVIAIANGSAERKKQNTSLGRRYRLPTYKEKELLRKQLKQRFAGTK